MKNLRGISFYIILFIIILIIIAMWSDFNNPMTMKYSEFKRELDSGNIKSIQVQGLDAQVILKARPGIQRKCNIQDKFLIHRTHYAINR